MKTIRRTRFFRCIVLPLALLAVLPACFKWEPLNGPVDRSITYGRPEQIRVVLQGGGHVDMKSPWIQGDSLVGLDPFFDKRTRTRDTLAVRLDRVSAIEIRKPDKVVGGFVGAAITVGLIYSMKDCCGGGFSLGGSD